MKDLGVSTAVGQKFSPCCWRAGAAQSMVSVECEYINFPIDILFLLYRYILKSITHVNCIL